MAADGIGERGNEQDHRNSGPAGAAPQATPMGFSGGTFSPFPLDKAGRPV